jgi:hypothetical protein
VQRSILRLYNLCGRPLGHSRGKFTAHLECKEDKCVNLLVDECVNYRRDAIFVALIEIKFQRAQMFQNSETALSCCVVNYRLLKDICLFDVDFVFKKVPQSFDVAKVAQVVD